MPGKTGLYPPFCLAGSPIDYPSKSHSDSENWVPLGTPLLPRTAKAKNARILASTSGVLRRPAGASPDRRILGQYKRPVGPAVYMMKSVSGSP